MNIKLYNGIKNDKNFALEKQSVIGTVVATIKKLVNKFKLNIKRVGAVATTALVLATPVLAKPASAESEATDSKASIVSETPVDFAKKLFESDMFVNEADILAYKFFVNIESIAAYVEKNGALPAEYAGLDLESLDFDQLLVMANRVNDAIGNTGFDSEVETVIPTCLIDNADQGHIAMIERDFACLDTITESTSCWAEDKSLAEVPEACKAIEDHMKLIRQSRTYLTAGEQFIMAGNNQNIAGFIAVDGGLANEYAEDFASLGASGVDYTFEYDSENGSIIYTNYGRLAELTNGVRANLGYAEKCR